MLPRNSTNLAVYRKIKRVAELCWPRRTGWLAGEGFQCIVWLIGDGRVPQLHSAPWWWKTGEGIREGPPWQGANPRMFAQLGFARPRSLSVCMCVRDAKALGIPLLKPHVWAHAHTIGIQKNIKNRIMQSTQGTHTAPPHTPGLKLLFILVTGCGSGVILLQYWVTTTTLMPPFKFNSCPI